MKKGGELSDAFAVRRGGSETVAKAAGVTTCATAIEGGGSGAGGAAGCMTVVSVDATDDSCEQHGIAAWIVVTDALMQHATAHAGRAPAASATIATSAVIDALNREVLVRFC